MRSPRAQEEATRRDVLARLDCTFSPRINRPRGDSTSGGLRTQPTSAASSTAAALTGSAPREGGLVSYQVSEGLNGVNAVHNRLYRAALLSRQRLQEAVRRAEQARFSGSWAGKEEAVEDTGLLIVNDSDCVASKTV